MLQKKIGVVENIRRDAINNNIATLIKENTGRMAVPTPCFFVASATLNQ